MLNSDSYCVIGYGLVQVQFNLNVLYIDFFSEAAKDILLCHQIMHFLWMYTKCLSHLLILLYQPTWLLTPFMKPKEGKRGCVNKHFDNTTKVLIVIFLHVTQTWPVKPIFDIKYVSVDKDKFNLLYLL